MLQISVLLNATTIGNAIRAIIHSKKLKLEDKFTKIHELLDHILDHLKECLKGTNAHMNYKIKHMIKIVQHLKLKYNFTYASELLTKEDRNGSEKSEEANRI